MVTEYSENVNIILENGYINVQTKYIIILPLPFKLNGSYDLSGLQRLFRRKGSHSEKGKDKHKQLTVVVGIERTRPEKRILG